MSDSSGINIAGMPDQAIGVITAPRAFFRGMARTGGYIDPIVFLVVMGLAAALIQIVLGFMGLGQAGITAMAATGFVAIIMLPIFLVIGGFIGAAISFVIWRFMGSQQGYETAFRCVAYMSAILPITALLSAIPYLGGIIHVVWAFYLVIIASVEVHGIRERTAQIVFGIIGLIVLVMSVSNEYAARNFAERFDQMSRGFGENIENKSPEEVGQAVGEFLKGLENATRQDTGSSN